MNKNKSMKKWVIPIIGLLMLLASLWIGKVRENRALLLYDQQAATRWQGGEDEFAQVSAFFARAEHKGTNDIKSIENGIMKKLYEDAFLDMGNLEHAFLSSYCGMLEQEVRKDNTTLHAQVYAVGGDFFKIHAMPLVSGDYLNDDDPFTIVLDEYMAWNLFGSSNVAGMKVWIGNDVYTITGVVGVDESKDARTAYGNYNAVYIPYDAVIKKKMQDDVPITCYEAVMQNPIKDYAYNTLAEACGVTALTDEEKAKQRSSLDFGTVTLVENSDRFSFSSLWNTKKNSKYQSMRTNEIVFPYWENVARFEEQHQIRFLIPQLLLLVVPLLALLVFVIVCLIRTDYKKVGYFLSRPFRAAYKKIESSFPEKEEVANGIPVSTVAEKITGEEVTGNEDIADGE